MRKEINVTKSFLPPQSEFNAILKKAWDASWITNRGQLVLELEEKLKNFLQVSNVIAMTNGTLPLQIAIKALNLTGEIITTPFSYVATTSSIVWEGCTPMFVDIHPEYLTIDENKIEDAITAKTTAIMATHVFGNPCNVKAIQSIAEKYNLKVIYDAAHCFGVKYLGESIFNYGDVSTCSFHATKIFHTGEGGAMFCNDTDLNNKLFYHHNFGHEGHNKFYGLGINAKMSELQAAMGLAVFSHFSAIKDARLKLYEKYKTAFDSNKQVSLLRIREETEINGSYFPLIFETEEVVLEVIEVLSLNNIYPRRYFYPSLNKLDYVIETTECPISEYVSSRILCLPLFYGLEDNDVDLIINLLESVL
ncbi:DegT/DnrJ/EryC1/StrS family aminotransferase [uncultured Dokdonia sp.]|uniref:DegT/DnrJ/EryC1/StrS family aminotransferase n=1 Tax=uncultured Dokdonia sp. TaxID=575653 RepID=UPI0030EBBADE|tara:strand:+ start:42212 stop:43300 length:1089 start_codon:yes stop_codon:yes gene_type:complete